MPAAIHGVASTSGWRNFATELGQKKRERFDEFWAVAVKDLIKLLMRGCSFYLCHRKGPTFFACIERLLSDEQRTITGQGCARANDPTR